jgi:N-acylneuraminate cytidylyltransferase
MRLAIIPARSGSTRIKDKNVIDFCGQPLIARPLAAAKESDLFDSIHVSTDSEHYAEIVRGLGFKIDFLRDPSLADNHTSLTGVLRWVVREYEKRGKRFDEVCMVMATAALVEAEDLKRGHKLFIEHGRQIPVLAVSPFPAPPERSLGLGKDGILEPRFPEMWDRRSQDLKPAYYDAGAFFFVDAKQLTGGTGIPSKFLPCMLPRHKAVDIDEPEDLEMAELLALGLKAKKARRTP